MDFDPRNLPLGEIDTHWSLWQLAHQGTLGQARAARERLLERYGGAVRRYLRGAVRQPEASAELFQEFALRFLQGRLAGADPRRGRLRDFVKGVLFHLIADYHKRLRRHPRPLSPRGPEPEAAPADMDAADRTFLARWRDDLLARTWELLDQQEGRPGRQYALVLRIRKEYPRLRSPELAALLSARLGKPVSAVGARLLLHRARARFAELLVREVANSLDRPTAAELAEELADLGLLKYCLPALQGYGRGNRPE